MSNSQKFILRITCAFIGLLLLASQPQAQTYSYEVVGGQILDINNKGEYIYITPNVRYGFYLPVPAYGLPAGVNNLPALDGSNSARLVAINDQGVVVGESAVEGEVTRHLTIWMNGVPIDIEPPNSDLTRATGINNLGHIIGDIAIPDGGSYGYMMFFYDGLQFHDLEPSGYSACWASYGNVTMMNNLDVMLGTWICKPSQYEEGTLERYKWEGTSATIFNFSDNFRANGINDSGQILGYINASPYETAIYEDGALTYLPKYKDSLISGGGFINDLGQVVGRGRIIGSNRHDISFIWLREAAYGLPAGLHELNDLVDLPTVNLLHPWAINNLGQIAIKGVQTSSPYNSVQILLTPIPLPPTMIVNSVGDESDNNPGDSICATSGGDCTFRAAIEESNAMAGINRIEFDIPGSGIPVIQPTTELPHITEAVDIIGSTQLDVMQVELNGLLLPQSGTIDGLTITSGECKITGLIIDQFPGNGLVLDGGIDNNIFNNLIGSHDDLTAGNGNGFHGILIKNSSDNIIGGDVPDSLANIIANNAGAGIFIEAGSGNIIQRNSIFENGLMGIDIAPMNINENDTLDTDNGPNGMQNYPTVDSVISDQDSSTVFCELMSEPSMSYLVEIYTNTECDPSGNGEGLASVWTTTADTDADGIAKFQTTLGLVITDSIGLSLTATADDGSTSEFSPCFLEESYYIKIVDVDSNIIANREFELFRVENIKPLFTETPLGTFATDEDGEILLTTSMLASGDFLRVYKYLGAKPAVRHVDILGTKFSVHLDNAKFDTLGHMYYEETTDDTLQIVVMDHSTFAYNILVSVEWNMDEEYHGWLQKGFKLMAYHMYDASDGQFRIDTVIILDDKEGWEEPDIRIYLDNDVWAHVEEDADGMNGGEGGPVEFGRVISGDKPDVLTISANPSVGHFETATYYMTLVHEFFHYAFSMYDEYRPPLGLPIRSNSEYCPDMIGRSYGIMDQHFTFWAPYSSEFSNSLTYFTSSCKNNMHWYKTKKSCWEVVEHQLEGVYSGLKVPIIMSTERNLPQYVQYLRGPNEYNREPDLETGTMVVFPMIPQPVTTHRRPVTVTDLFGDPVNKARLVQKRSILNGGPMNRIQGYTNYEGKLMALDMADGDYLDASTHLFNINDGLASSSHTTKTWVYGTSKDNLGISQDTARIVLTPIVGNLPVAVNTMINEDSLRITLFTPNLFISVPSMDQLKGKSSISSYNFELGAEGYFVSIPFDSTNSKGTFLINAVDSSGSIYVFDIDYSLTKSISGEPILITDPSGIDVTISIEDSTSMNEKALMLTTYYPLPRNGLTEINRSVGKSVSVSTYPANSLGEDAKISFRYDDNEFGTKSNILSSESSLEIFYWNIANQIWIPIVSAVGTITNHVTGAITEDGLYAVFTTDIPTGINDETGEVEKLPYRFELSQNYPNPFNPSTDIIFSIATRNHVTIEIFNVLGQQVKSLLETDLSAGIHSVIWDGNDDSGQPVSSGIYIYRFNAGEYTDSKKMLLLK